MDSWKEAASLIIVVENTSSPSSLSSPLSQSFNLLMTKRSDKASFLGSAFVFPGGHLETSDFSPEWWKVFNQAGFSESHVNSVVKRINGPRTPIITECQTKLAAQQQFSSSSSSKDNVLPSDIGLRICAIRETFEETGVLLAHNSSNSIQLDAISVENWRSKVRENANDFIQFCLEMKIAPNIWDLYEWSNWLTPNALGHRRFDTMFYIYCTSNKPETDSDQKEVATIEWYTPNELLDLQKQQKAFLAPPQVYELSRLSNFKEFHELKDFVFKRESDGVERWIPLIKGYADGSVFFLPGDDSYGLDIKTSIRSMPTLEQARSLVSHLNRIEFKQKVLRAFCNIKLNCGQISPLTFPSAILQSSL
ncbi:nucleoside diphosphate-linked moiety X motif 19-like [Tetranychus urticae]|uniref:Nudix hydrolase domain-containing protein n=1 Tax=Tetranychus urticae TaxID=32264 RepID=T1KXY3_TETUR|nr:nucleoside diphosphate-linked moiety X motif 19-like [Tetranychus urticae]XP_025017885.1 nucleoside diphosphate-linked moiety X motif 19-like [Tetranychus urticae]